MKEKENHEEITSANLLPSSSQSKRKSTTCDVTKLQEMKQKGANKDPYDKGNLLIHCVQGVSRSCSFAIAYLIWCYGIKYTESYDIVRKARPISSPNTGFICQLLEWEKYRLFGAHKVKLQKNLIALQDGQVKENLEVRNQGKVKEKKIADESLFEDEGTGFLREDTILGHKIDYRGCNNAKPMYCAKILRSSIDRSLSPLRKSMMASEACYLIEVISAFYKTSSNFNTSDNNTFDKSLTAIHQVDRVLYIWVGKHANSEAISACKRYANLILELEGRKSILSYTLSPLCLYEEDPKDEIYLIKNILGSKYNIYDVDPNDDKLEDLRHKNYEDEDNTGENFLKKKSSYDENLRQQTELDYFVRNPNNTSNLPGAMGTTPTLSLEISNIESQSERNKHLVNTFDCIPRSKEDQSISEVCNYDFYKTTDDNFCSKTPFTSRGRIDSTKIETKDCKPSLNELLETNSDKYDKMLVEKPCVDNEPSGDLYENVKVEVYRIANTNLLRNEESEEGEDNIRKEIEWEKLGVYDDDDLEDDSVLFVHANNSKVLKESSLWVGSDYCTLATLSSPTGRKPQISGVDFDIGSVLESIQVKVDQKLNISDFTNVIRSGEETDRFWSLFEAGY